MILFTRYFGSMKTEAQRAKKTTAIGELKSKQP
jgi:hypothetical protein